MGYLILTAETDTDGMLKDLAEIREMVRNLDHKAMELQRRITIRESAEDDSTTDSNRITGSENQ